MEKENKYNFVSAMKLFGVLIVVLGHSMILYQDDWGVFIPRIKSESLNIIKNYINIFQMPLFVMISGYLFYNSLHRKKYTGIKELINDKFNRLIIPLLFVANLYVIPIRLFVKYENYNGSFIKAIELLWC